MKYWFISIHYLWHFWDLVTFNYTHKEFCFGPSCDRAFDSKLCLVITHFWEFLAVGVYIPQVQTLWEVQNTFFNFFCRLIYLFTSVFIEIPIVKVFNKSDYYYSDYWKWFNGVHRTNGKTLDTVLKISHTALRKVFSNQWAPTQQYGPSCTARKVKRQTWPTDGTISVSLDDMLKFYQFCRYNKLLFVCVLSHGSEQFWPGFNWATAMTYIVGKVCIGEFRKLLLHNSDWFFN